MTGSLRKAAGGFARPGPVDPRFRIGLELLCLLIVLLLSVSIGSQGLILPDFSGMRLGTVSDYERDLLIDLRVPRTLLGILAGAALGVAGVVMQAATRNPLADPGLLGVNAGATVCVVFGIGFLDMTGLQARTGLALLGAGTATVLVYAIAMAGGGRLSPLRLTLSGVAFSAMLGGVSRAMMLIDPQSLDFARHWATGAIAIVGYDIPLAVLPLVLPGIVMAFALHRSLDNLALGEDISRSLGVPMALHRIACLLTITLLAGAATAAAGPVAFIGLLVAHLARLSGGSGHGTILVHALLLGPCLLVSADIFGRLIVWPGELPASVVSAFIGAPVLILLARRVAARGV